MIEYAICVLVCSLTCLHAVNCYKEHLEFIEENSREL